jgi:hypothetical protein
VPSKLIVAITILTTFYFIIEVIVTIVAIIVRITHLFFIGIIVTFEADATTAHAQ